MPPERSTGVRLSLEPKEMQLRESIKRQAQILLIENNSSACNLLPQAFVETEKANRPQDG